MVQNAPVRIRIRSKGLRTRGVTLTYTVNVGELGVKPCAGARGREWTPCLLRQLVKEGTQARTQPAASQRDKH